MFKKKKKVAVILFNLGGPDNLENVKPFLFNLFYDKNIINLPNPFRFLLAWIISTFRAGTAKKIYALMGGKSTILEETKQQAAYLEKYLSDDPDANYKVFVSMRHWHPMASEVIEELEKLNLDKIILLPLYPQYSTTTSGSAIEDFMEKKANHAFLLATDFLIICCHSKDDSFIAAHAELIRQNIADLDNFRILFSAHGLPQKIVDQGDPYQYQVEESVKNIINDLNIESLDYKISYQSKVGPMKWLLPSTEEEIIKAAKEGKNIVIVPIAFVSEHSETLVELDIEYKDLIKDFDIKYKRVKTLGVNDLYIKSLGEMIKRNNDIGNITCSSRQRRECPKDFKKCPCKL